MGDNHYILSEKRAHNSSDLTLTTFYKITSGSFIELCDQSGRMVYRQAIISSKVKVPTRRMKGMYIYNVIASGKSVNTGKVIVQ